jgi:predicted deacylase
MSIKSDQPGPVIWLTACAHGDEVCGMVVIHEIFRKAKKQLLCGSINAIPLMNPFGFEHGTRMITPSQEDLNRCFPGNSQGSLGERMASDIFSMVMESNPDLVLDLHTDWKRSVLYAVLDAYPGSSIHKPAYELAKKIALDTNLIVIQEQEILEGTLSYNLLLNSVPSLTLELGEPYVINEINVSAGVDAIWSVITSMKMCKSPDPLLESASIQVDRAANIYQYFDLPHSSTSGIIRFLAQPGQSIRAGQPFAKISNAFGKHQETINAMRDGMILGHTDSSVVFPGMPIMAFGVTSIE